MGLNWCHICSVFIKFEVAEVSMHDLESSFIVRSIECLCHCQEQFFALISREVPRGLLLLNAAGSLHHNVELVFFLQNFNECLENHCSQPVLSCVVHLQEGSHLRV